MLHDVIFFIHAKFIALFVYKVLAGVNGGIKIVGNIRFSGGYGFTLSFNIWPVRSPSKSYYEQNECIGVICILLMSSL